MRIIALSTLKAFWEQNPAYADAIEPTLAWYRHALKEIEILMMTELDSPEGEKLDVLATLVEAYEHKHYPLDLPDPVEAIKFEMEQKGS